MKQFLAILLTFSVGLIIGHKIPHNDDCVWDINKDPRGCTISWDDGTFSWKSRIIELGTLEPGEKKTIYLLGQEQECSEPNEATLVFVESTVSMAAPIEIGREPEEPCEPNNIILDAQLTEENP